MPQRGRRGWRTVMWLVSVLVISLTQPGTGEAAAPPPGFATRYTMTAFTNSSESNMYVYDSPDATGFRLLRGPRVHAALGPDPRSQRHPAHRRALLRGLHHQLDR